MKHVSTKYLWLQDHIANETVLIEKVPTDEMLADCLTKVVPTRVVEYAMSEARLEYQTGIAEKQKRTLTREYVTEADTREDDTQATDTLSRQRNVTRWSDEDFTEKLQRVHHPIRERY